jgi:hypothetical protein
LPSDATQADDSTGTGRAFIPDLDSAGVYYLPGGDEESVIWRYKMELLWEYKDLADVVVLGSSRVLYGIDPTLFSEDHLAISMANLHNTIKGSKYIFDNYVITHMKNLKYVVLGVDIDRGYLVSGNSFFHKKYKEIPGFSYDVNHQYWKNQSTDFMVKAVRNAPGSTKYSEIILPTRGHFKYTSSSGWGSSPTVKNDSSWYDENPKLYYDNFQVLEDFIKKCQERGVYIIGVILPQSPDYKNTGAFGFGGIRRSVAPDLIEEISGLSDKYSRFILLDENKMGNHDYTSEMALDCSHLNHAGAEQLTHRIDSLIKTLNIDFDN